MCSFQGLNLKHQGDGFRYSISQWKRIGRPKTRRNPVHLEYVKFLNPEPKLYSHTAFPKTWFSGQWLLYLQDLVCVEHLLDGTLNLYQAVLQSAALASQVQVLKPLLWWSTIGFILLFEKMYAYIIYIMIWKHICLRNMYICRYICKQC